jgi:glycerophosphoryl diester phosphodiesterase
MQIIGHRGDGKSHNLPSEIDAQRASERPAENSIAAFRKGFETGDGIELDVVLTKDGELVCMHAEELAKHTIDCLPDSNTSDYGLDELQALSLIHDAENHSIPTLRSVLAIWNEFYPTKTLNIELKGRKTAEPVMRLLAEHDIAKPENINISSFDHDMLMKTKKMREEMELGIRIGALFEINDESKPMDEVETPIYDDTEEPKHVAGDLQRIGKTIRKLQPDTIHVHINDLKHGINGVLDEGGSRPIFVWTTDEPLPKHNEEQIKEFLNLKKEYPNIHWITDHPEELKSMLTRIEERVGERGGFTIGK